MNMNKRYDIHTPSSKSFNPEAYECLGVIDTNPTLIYGVDHSVSVVSDQTDFGLNNKIIKALISGYKFADHVIAKAYKDKQDFEASIVENDTILSIHHCGHCGHAIRYGAVLLHNEAKEIIYVGSECLNNRFTDMTKDAFQILRKQAHLNKEQSKKQKSIDEIINQYPFFKEDIKEYKNNFLNDVNYRLFSTGKLSDKQISAYAKALDRAKHYKANPIVKHDAPNGKFDISGKIIKIHEKRDVVGRSKYYITIETSQLWKLYVAIPQSIKDANIGDSVAMTVNVTPSQNNPRFAFGKYPTKATRIK